MFGVILIIIGVVFLLKNMGIITGGVWNIVWPCLLIALGLKFAVGRRCRGSDKFNKFGEHMEKFGAHMEKFGDEMKKEFSEDKK